MCVRVRVSELLNYFCSDSELLVESVVYRLRVIHILQPPLPLLECGLVLEVETAPLVDA